MNAAFQFYHFVQPYDKIGTSARCAKAHLAGVKNPTYSPPWGKVIREAQISVFLTKQRGEICPGVHFTNPLHLQTSPCFAHIETDEAPARHSMVRSKCDSSIGLPAAEGDKGTQHTGETGGVLEEAD